ncbi:rCG62911 [Rattus norvegicus]|uniref:RCG62911 n=1 Tax=Rattus norvegicus TaxID=10116 RepID=A6J2M3_RAT|nr:rCG62911 [Rattus norvegicus]
MSLPPFILQVHNPSTAILSHVRDEATLDWIHGRSICYIILQHSM